MAWDQTQDLPLPRADCVQSCDHLITNPKCRLLHYHRLSKMCCLTSQILNRITPACKMTLLNLHHKRSMVRHRQDTPTSLLYHDMSLITRKPTKWVCTQGRLRSAWATTQSDQSSLCVQWVAKDPSFLHVDSEDSDQTGQMPRLI